MAEYATNASRVAGGVFFLHVCTRTKLLWLIGGLQSDSRRKRFVLRDGQCISSFFFYAFRQDCLDFFWLLFSVAPNIMMQRACGLSGSIADRLGERGKGGVEI